MNRLVILQVVVPLLGAPVCSLIRNRRLVHGATLAIVAATFGIAVMLALEVDRQGVLTYSIGGWAAPVGIEYRVDALTSFVLLLVSGVTALVMAYSRDSLEVEIPYDRYSYFHVMMLLSLAGLLGITITGDLFNVFVFLEISALSGYVLISMGKDRRALVAAYQYLILGTIGATFLLIGIGLMYMMTGTLNMLDMADRIVAVEGSRTILAAFAFVTVGLSIKMALFPFHQWLPNAYTYAPSVVTAFMASTATKVAVYVLLRFALTVYGVDFSFGRVPLPLLLMPMALAAMFSASAVAIFQNNVKRMLAYSSVAQIGYIVLGISLASVTGLTGGIVHLANHAIIKALLFCAVSCVVVRVGSSHIEDWRGIGRDMPWTMAAFVVGGLGLVGVPWTAGFVSKWYLVVAALERGWWLLAFGILVSSLLAMIYVGRVIEVAYFQERPSARDPVPEAPLSMLLPLYALAFICLFFGIDGELTAGLARAAAETLVNGGFALEQPLGGLP